MGKRKKARKVGLAELEERHAAMTQQLARVLHNAAVLEGALQLCGDLLNVLKGVRPVTEAKSDMPTEEDMERMRAESKAQRDAEAKGKTEAEQPKTTAKRPGK